MILSLSLGGCRGTVSGRIHAADSVAKAAQLQKQVIKTPEFALTSYARFSDPRTSIHVYIEGDGFAWVTKTQLSQNPTPREPLVLRLAALDTHPNVLYIARPCQYTPLSEDSHCAPKYWSRSRFAPEVVDSIDQVISTYVEKWGTHQVTLIGYSGGGGIAVLVAAQRKDVEKIITLAGNLDHVALNRYHHVSEMKDSLNPIDVATRVATIPQLHVSGADDIIVPGFIAHDFKNRSEHAVSGCIMLRTEPGVTHYQGWKKIWPRLLATAIECH